MKIAIRYARTLLHTLATVGFRIITN